MGFIPGAEAAKTTFDFIKAAISKPDAKKTSTWLDKLDVDDQMSAIVDDTVENGFMQAMAKSIESEADDKPLEPNFNMNAKMVNYLKTTYKGRTVAGITENKEMELQEYIKSLVQQELDEMSVSGDAGGYLSANAFVGSCSLIDNTCAANVEPATENLFVSTKYLSKSLSIAICVLQATPSPVNIALAPHT